MTQCNDKLNYKLEKLKFYTYACNAYKITLAELSYWFPLKDPYKINK